MTTLTKEQSAARGLIPEIKACYREHVKAGRDFMKNAIEIGRLLIKMKELLPHGEFTPIVEEQFEFGISQAQNYMRVADYVPKLPADVDPEEMSIKGLLRLAAEAKPKNVPGTHLKDSEPVTSKDVIENIPSPIHVHLGEKHPSEHPQDRSKEDPATSFDTAKLDAAPAPKPPKNGAAVKPEFDDAACKALYIRLVKMLDDRWTAMGGSIGHRNNATKRLGESFDAYQKWVVNK